MEEGELKWSYLEQTELLSCTAQAMGEADPFSTAFSIGCPLGL